MNSSLETVNAAAAAIVSAESRVQQVTVPRRRWNFFFSLYWCFGCHRQGKRISNAVLVPQQARPQVVAPPPENSSHPPALLLPFIAPPSSPVSFLQSEPPSATLSPTGEISFSALSNDIYSPGARPSIFSIGPYASETQLVSPPVFSAFTTEPSTAPFTPPPESVQFTTPSSPEVPFAKLLTSLDSNCKKSELHEFHSYQLYPGSPIGHLISLSSVCSGTSPFPDRELHPPRTGSFPIPNSKPSLRELVQCHASRINGLILGDQMVAINPTMKAPTGCLSNEPVLDHRVSFELSAEEVAQCLGRKSIISSDSKSEFPVSAETLIDGERHEADGNHDNNVCVVETFAAEKPQMSITLSAVKEFKFSNSDDISKEPTMASEWWANEKVVGMASSHKNWAFPMIHHPGVG